MQTLKLVKNPLILFLLLLPVLIMGNSDGIIVGKRVLSQEVNDGSFEMKVNLSTLKDKINRKNKLPIILELDSNKTLTFVLKRFHQGKKDDDFTWVGKSQDGDEKVIFSVRNGVMFGTITTKEGKYKIYPENGRFKVMKVDTSLSLPFHLDTIMEPERKKIQVLDTLEEDATLQEEQSSTESDQQSNDETVQPSEPSVTDSVVTVLIYYTQALEDKYGANTEAIIQANFDLAKDAYIESNTEINLQIAALKKVPSNSLLSSADSNDLNDLLSKLEEDTLVRYERQIYHADAVTVLSWPENLYSCGLGSTPSDIESPLLNAFTAVHIKPISEGGYYCPDLSFAHELGHNFGCFHDSDHVSSGTPMFPYAYGYDIENEFGTIMSYDGPEISYFSNPNKTYTNPDTGNTNTIGDADTANNARTIRENQFKMADNSEQISESLESNDNDLIEGYKISGFLNNSYDRDGYIVWLEGNTRFLIGNSSVFVNLYNESTHELVESFNQKDKTFLLGRGKYRIVVSFTNDKTGSYYDKTSTQYTVDVSTEYTDIIIPAIIQYLLN
jgi:hypothetical protein